MDMKKPNKQDRILLKKRLSERLTLFNNQDTQTDASGTANPAHPELKSAVFHFIEANT